MINPFQVNPDLLAMLAPMAGTLNDPNALSAQDTELQSQLSQRAQAAAQAASQAGQAYQGAAQAPSPEPGVADQLPGLFSNVASVLSGNQAYGQRAHENLKQRHDTLLQNRLQNLQALKDQFDQKARAAEQIGNLQAAEDARLQSEKFARVHADLLSKRMEAMAKERENAATELENQRQKGRVEIQGMKSRAVSAKSAKDTADYFDSLQKTTRNGNAWLDSTNVPPRDKHQMMIYAKDNKRMVVDKGTADRLNAAEEVYSNFDDIEKVLRGFLPATPGGRIESIPKNVWAQITQSDPNIASFSNTQLAAIRNIQALASGIGSGFRLNEQEIKRAIANFPKITDDLPTALRRLEWERNFLKSKEHSFFGRNFQAAAQQAPQADPLGIR
jgi:hypothetical protein